MLSDSAEIQANGDKTATEDKKKRKLKSPNQVNALENLYNEHKYPSEEMKVKLAEEIGLTEKQVSGWFCHRRIKDKRLPKDEGNNIVSQDRSSVVLPDRGSGYHRQDSCGSTKQTDYMNPKPSEVESQRLYRGSYQMENVDGADSSSSESSSSLHGHHLVFNKNGIHDVENPRDVSRNRVVTPLHPQVIGSYGRNKPSGYLKVKGQTEKAAITSVKRQLGRHFEEVGPPLGVHFDPLPPGAFESPTKHIVQEPMYVGNHRHSHSPYVTGVRRNSNPGPSYGAHNSKMHSIDSYMEEENDDDDITVGNESGFRDKKSLQEPRLKSPSLNYYDSVPENNSFKEMCKGSPRETPLINSKKHRLSPKHEAEGVRNKGNIKIDDILQHDKINKSTASHKSGYFTKPSNLAPWSGGRSPDSMEKGLSSGMAAKYYYGERNIAKMHREKLHPIGERPVTKRVKHGYLQQGYAPNAIQGLEGQIKGCGVEVPLSSSEDETSSSSMD